MVKVSFVSFKIQQKTSNKEGYQKRKILRFKRAKSTNHLRRKVNSNKQSKNSLLQKALYNRSNKFSKLKLKTVIISLHYKAKKNLTKKAKNTELKLSSPIHNS